MSRHTEGCGVNNAATAAGLASIWLHAVKAPTLPPCQLSFTARLMSLHVQSLRLQKAIPHYS